MTRYVACTTFEKVKNPFEAEVLWKANGFFLAGRRPLLRDTLEDNPSYQRGNTTMNCFSHVEIMLPKSHVDHDRLAYRGRRSQDLCGALVALHKEDLGKFTREGSDIRYRVVSSPTLADDAVVARFGHAVYVPGPEDQPLYRLESSTDSVIWTRLDDIYPDQRLTLLSGNPLHATCTVPHWPFPASAGLMLLNEPDSQELSLVAEPGSRLESRLDTDHGYHVITPCASPMPEADAGVDAAPARLLLRVTRLAAQPKRVVAPAPAPVPTAAPVVSPTEPAKTATAKSATVKPAVRVEPVLATEPTAPMPPDAGTYMPMVAPPASAPGAEATGGTYMPVIAHKVQLVALALPRLSCYSHAGAKALTLGFDRQLRLVPGNRDAVLKLRVGIDDLVHAETPAGRQVVQFPASFSPVTGADICLSAMPGAMGERYLALVTLPHPVLADLPAGARFTVGRGNPTLAQLRVLDSPDFLTSTATGEDRSTDRLGLSRKAFSVEAGPDGMEVRALAAGQALFHLDDSLGFIGKIEAVVTGAPYKLPNGHHLVAGHYVLKYIA